MLNKRIQLAIAVLALVFAAAGEELLPPCLGVGLPLLLAAAVAMARRRPAVTAVFFAVAAGAFEDALSSLPPLTSVGFFLFAAIAARSSLTPAPALFAAYPLYQLWLSVWIAESGGGVFWRTLAALPVGAAALVAVAALLFWVDGKAGVNERG